VNAQGLGGGSISYYLCMWVLAEFLHVMSAIDKPLNNYVVGFGGGTSYRKMIMYKIVSILHFFFVMVGSAGFVAEYLNKTDIEVSSGTYFQQVRGALMGCQIFLLCVIVACMCGMGHLFPKHPLIPYLCVMYPFVWSGNASLVVIFLGAVGAMVGSLGLLYMALEALAPEYLAQFEKLRAIAYCGSDAVSVLPDIARDFLKLVYNLVVTFFVAMAVMMWWPLAVPAFLCDWCLRRKGQWCGPWFGRHFLDVDGMGDEYWAGICIDALAFSVVIVLVLVVIVYPCLAMDLYSNVAPHTLHSVTQSVSGNGGAVMVLWLVSKISSLLLGLLYPVLFIAANRYGAKLKKGLEKYANYELIQLQLLLEIVRLNNDERTLERVKLLLDYLEELIAKVKSDSSSTEYDELETKIKDTHAKIAAKRSAIDSQKIGAC